MYRIVATDVDETFLNAEHLVPQANIDAILRMRELGVLFVPASGRPYGSIMDSLRDVPLAKCLYMRHDLDYLHKVADEMDPSLTQGVDVTYSSGRFLEFNPEGVDKGAGLRALADMLGVPMEETIGCGDSANDIAMLEAAGVGVAVSNATPDAVAAADYQAQASCDDGVFAEVLEKFIEPAVTTRW